MSKLSKIKNRVLVILSLMTIFLWVGCNKIGDKSANMSIIYGVMILIAVVLLVVYCLVIHDKEIWFLMLATSIIVVNTGYLSLSVSKTIEEALLANRIAYFGSVFLPMAMFMIIIRTCNINYKKWMPSILLLVSICVFIVAASPGYLDIYYKSVTLQKVNGCTVLEKTYGSWHSLYLVYLLVYFLIMIIAIVQASMKNKIISNIHSIILAGAVLVNIGVWMIGQLVKIEFEFLSISYIISEFFLLCLYVIIQEQDIIFGQNQKINNGINGNIIEENSYDNNVSILSQEGANDGKNDIEEFVDGNLYINNEIEDNQLINNEQKELFIVGVKHLTPKETTIYNYYIQGKKTKEILKELEITENTLKYHNKNIYSKLGVTSRKQLRVYAEQYM